MACHHIEPRPDTEETDQLVRNDGEGCQDRVHLG